MKRFSKVKAVKDNARTRIGQPKPSRIIVPKKNKQPKYKEKYEP